MAKLMDNDAFVAVDSVISEADLGKIKKMTDATEQWTTIRAINDYFQLGAVINDVDIETAITNVKTKMAGKFTEITGDEGYVEPAQEEEEEEVDPPASSVITDGE